MPSAMATLRAYLSLVAIATFGVSANPVDDAASLVQSRLEGGRRGDGGPLSLAMESNGTNVSNSSANYMRQNTMYRIVFSENFGATYHCLTEIEFFDKDLNPITATFKAQTSCYGCATVCDACEAAYGNPRAQFDGEAGESGSVEDSMWSCSAVGSFTDGLGMESLEFELPVRPARYVLKRAAVGDYVAKAWALQEQKFSKLVNGTTWNTISQVANATLGREQSVDVMESVNVKPFPKDFRTCGGAYPTPILEFEPDLEGKILDARYKPGMHLSIVNNGYGVQVDGNFGELTLEDGVYDAVQINIQFPSEHKLPGTEAQAVGEMHIMHQSRYEVGKPTRLAFVTILLQLPQEGDDPTQEEMFFRGLGLDALPEFGAPKALTAVDLTMLGSQLSSTVTTVPCTETMRWFVASQYAHVSGFIVQAFRLTFAGGLNYNALDALQEEEGEDIEETPLDAGATKMNLTALNNTTTLADGTTRWTPAVQELTKTQKADAYATGEWRSQFSDPDEPEANQSA